MGDGELDRLRAALIERTAFDFDKSEPNGIREVPCVCAVDRKPCTYHEGVEVGVDAVLDLLDPVSDVHERACETTGEPSFPCDCIAKDTTLYRLRTPKETQ